MIGDSTFFSPSAPASILIHKLHIPNGERWECGWGSGAMPSLHFRIGKVLEEGGEEQRLEMLWNWKKSH